MGSFQQGVHIMKTVFTTGEVGKICKVAIRTVRRWFDSARLPGYRIQGSKARRIPRQSLVEFLKTYGMPMNQLGEKDHSVLFVGNHGSLIASDLKGALSSDEFEFDTVESAFHAGFSMKVAYPDCVVIDFEIGRDHALHLARALQKRTEQAQTVLIFLVGNGESANRFDGTLFTETFCKPFNVTLLATRIQTLVARKKQIA